ncbi:hypothetical protein BJ741DRAFT_597989 [Chytriomyces cf. hyalinus JEL632]|nr:hypothetical protein BJ741DRAFT_597989 [Chytriomyces cf. hyalinus JEL632]
MSRLASCMYIFLCREAKRRLRLVGVAFGTTGPCIWLEGMHCNSRAMDQFSGWSAVACLRVLWVVVEVLEVLKVVRFI